MLYEERTVKEQVERRLYKENDEGFRTILRTKDKAMADGIILIAETLDKEIDFIVEQLYSIHELGELLESATDEYIYSCESLEEEPDSDYRKLRLRDSVRRLNAVLKLLATHK